jgi:hypothetical protein
LGHLNWARTYTPSNRKAAGFRPSCHLSHCRHRFQCPRCAATLHSVDVRKAVGVDYPTGTDDTFTYDAVGNRLTRNSTNYTYDAADRLTAVASTSYWYDNNGNLTSRGFDSYSWDAKDRLTSATVSSATTTFAYNGDGLRDSLTFNSNTTTYTWDIAAGIAQVPCWVRRARGSSERRRECHKVRHCDATSRRSPKDDS